MTLKGFHVIFITASIILSLLFGLWAYQNYITLNGFGYLITALLSTVFAVALGIYELIFIKKIK